MNRNELGKIAARAVLDAEGKGYDVDKIGEGATWHEGAAAVYRKAIEDAEAALDAVDEEDSARTMPEFREAVRAKLRGLLDD